MKKVTYYNKFGDKCVRHGNIKKTSTHYVFTPSDSTRKKIIKFNDLIKISKCRVRKTKMVYEQGIYISQPDDPT